MKLLDLFCGAGGAAVGYHRAGFDDIIGIDIVPQPNYPFTFIQADALNPPVDLGVFDLIHASPPCQAYSVATRDPSRHPDLLAPTRDMLAAYPSVIENVVGSPINGYLRLCGSMFGLDIQRHRYFEFAFPALSPACNHKAWIEGRPWTITGKLDNVSSKHRHSWKPSRAKAAELMGMDWASWQEVVEAIPPVYTEHIGQAFMETVR